MILSFHACCTPDLDVLNIIIILGNRYYLNVYSSLGLLQTQFI